MKKLLLLLTCVTVLFGCGDKDKESKKVTYKEPILTFGASKSTIKKQEKRDLLEDESRGLLYSEANYMVIYLFEEDKLYSSGVIMPLGTDMDKLTDYISSRYTYVGKSEGILLWTSKDRQIGIACSSEVIGIYVMYLPLTEDYSSPTKATNDITQQVELVKEEINAILQ